MSGLCDLHDYPEHERIAIAIAVRDSLMPAPAPVLPLVAFPPEHAGAGALSTEGAT
ncbi:MAG: hypothetical protein GAK28_00590 [Luteibacter sp.]|uniref:hypothetical protein n=1 Tax=Luteibacter sp. TaxID=1886636 RepID=UPI00138058E6|nr:hypothetical protein [Luteibacter sp.]KAF1008958.1 MAG: hypothetical protein GAK28_00590 [Luteibacter sp.]